MYVRRIYQTVLSLLCSSLVLLAFIPATQAQRTVSGSLLMPDTKLNHELEDAVLRHDLKRTRQLLDAGADADLVRGSTSGTDKYSLWQSAAIDTKRDADLFALLATRVRDVNQPASDGSTLLATAAGNNDLTLVKSLVARGAKLNAISGKELPTNLPASTDQATGFSPETTPLLAAIDYSTDNADLTPVTLFLLEAGADPNFHPTSKSTPLTRAATLGKTETVRALLAHGADPKIRDRIGFTALRWASQARRPAVIALLRDISPLDLHEAAQFGVPAKVQERLDAGDDPNGLDFLKETPLMNAARGGSMEVVTLLIKHGAKVDTQKQDGVTALYLAALFGLTDMVRLLLDNGADINATSVLAPPRTALTSAAGRAQADVVALLLQRGVALEQHGQGATALALAIHDLGSSISVPISAPAARTFDRDQADDNRQRIIDLLADAGGKTLIRANQSYALYVAAEHAQRDVVRFLLEKGADVNGRNRTSTSAYSGETALIGGIKALGMADDKSGKKFATETVQLLLAHGASVTLTSVNGETALMEAYASNQWEIFRGLMGRGASVDAQDREGTTVLMQAAAYGDDEWVRRLLQAGANPDLRDAKGKTALDLARKSDSPKVITLLKQAEKQGHFPRQSAPAP